MYILTVMLCVRACVLACQLAACGPVRVEIDVGRSEREDERQRR